MGVGSNGCDDFDFDQRIARQARDGDGRAGRSGDAFRGQVLCVDGVHGGEVLHIFEEDDGLDDAGEIAAGGDEDGFDVFEDPRGLIGDGAGDDLTGGGIEGDLSGSVEEIAKANGLGIRADSGGSVLRRDGGLLRFVHGIDCAGVGRPVARMVRW